MIRNRTRHYFYSSDRLFSADQNLRGLCLQYLFMPQRTLEGGLHFHVLELGDGKVQVLQSFFLFSRVMLQNELGKLEAGKRQLRPELHLSTDFDGFLIVFAGFIISTKQRRCPAQMARDAGRIINP